MRLVKHDVIYMPGFVSLSVLQAKWTPENNENNNIIIF